MLKIRRFSVFSYTRARIRMNHIIEWNIDESININFVKYYRTFGIHWKKKWNVIVDLFIFLNFPNFKIIFALFLLYLYIFVFLNANSIYRIQKIKMTERRRKETRINEARIIRNFTSIDAFPSEDLPNLFKHKNTYELKFIERQSFLFRPIGSLSRNWIIHRRKSSNLNWFDLFEVNRSIEIKLRYEKKRKIMMKE